MTKKKKSLVHKIHLVFGIFWLCNIPPVVIAYVIMGEALFQKVMLLYLAIISIVTAALTDFAALSGERAKEEAQK